MAQGYPDTLSFMDVWFVANNEKPNNNIVVSLFARSVAYNLFSLPCRMVGCGAAHDGSLCPFALHFLHVRVFG